MDNKMDAIYFEEISSLEFYSTFDISIDCGNNQNLINFILDNYNDAIYILKYDTTTFDETIVGFNKNLCYKTGYSKEELLNINYTELFSSDSIIPLKSCFHEKKLKWESNFLHKNGNKIPIEIKSTIYCNENDNFKFVFLFLRDISSHNQSKQELIYHKSLLNRSEFIGSLGYWEYDNINDKLWASNGAKAIYGTESELTLDEIKTLALPLYRPILENAYKNLTEHGLKYDVEYKIKRRNDEKIIDIRSMAEFDICDRKIYGIIQDISQQKMFEQELIKAKEKAEESDKLKTSFLSNMSHEIRTPMNGIVGFSQFLAEKDIDNDTRIEYKELIHKCCNQLLGTVNDILEIAKIEAGQVIVNNETVNINILLNEMYESCLPMAMEKKIDLILNSNNRQKEQIIFTDKEKLNKILVNLIENGVRFTSNGYVEFGCIDKDSKLEFYVKDTGIGISAENHEIIFKPFCQADWRMAQQYGGTGLGLTITKTFVSMLEGEMWLESQIGNGTTFYFTLPIIEKTIKSDEIINIKKSEPKKRICLVVEDIEMNYLYLNALLKQLDFIVLWAKDGNEAIKIVLENNDIELVLMDIRMPNTDGYEATRIIKQQRPNIPIIAQTANALVSERKKAMEAGCDHYITKPFYKEDFIKILEKYFDN